MLIKNGGAGQPVDTVVFGKTGTLTLEHPSTRGWSCRRICAPWPGGLARASSHPLAGALAARLPGAEIADLREVPGYGVGDLARRDGAAPVGRNG